MGRKSLMGAPDQTRLRIEAMEEQRSLRRTQMKQARVDRAAEEQRNISAGNPGDVDFIGLVRRWREEHAGMARPHRHAVDTNGGSGGKNDNICVCIRKRPLNDKERKKKEHDAVTVLHPTATVHSAKLRVDGIHKYLDHNSFRFDHSFDEDSSTEQVYQYTAQPLVSYVCGGRGVRATVFAYGQTGSGKTHTMSGIQKMVADDIFSFLSDNVLEDDSCCSCDNTTISIAIFEIYGGRIQDLLNKRNRLKVLEDGRGEVVISGLEEFEASTPEDFLALIEAGQNNRTTHATEANDESSRSHSICQVLFRDSTSRRLKAKLSLVDLAGSERGSDTKSHNRQRRTESSDINTSLLALKECIRAIDGDSRHVPYRQSKLTLILKDSFTSNYARTAMIATLAPGSLSTDHTVNTLRYADRIKEKKIGDSFTPSQRRSPVRQAKSPVRKEIVEEKVDMKEHRDEIDENISDNILYEDDNNVEEEIQELTKFEEPDNVESQGPSEFDQVVQQLFDEEEQLLSLHMQSIQQNAEYITEENKLLESVQGENVDVDAYALRLAEILQHKTEMIQAVRGRLEPFRELLRKEEELSKKY